MNQVIKDERTIGDLFTELANETGTLIRQELSLAQAELTKKAVDAGRKAGIAAAGGALAYAGVLSLAAALILLFSYAIPAWLAALIVGLGLSAAGYLLVTSGINELKRIDMAPSETVENIKEDAKWLKDQMT